MLAIDVANGKTFTYLTMVLLAPRLDELAAEGSVTSRSAASRLSCETSFGNTHSHRPVFFKWKTSTNQPK
ncbi:hypothetical protein IMZ48_43630 [Candidatus Bathyarchaeota archaeon]|nr:hypothetical protein [Candidatus Bathyarchaeota archaeon]